MAWLLEIVRAHGAALIFFGAFDRFINQAVYFAIQFVERIGRDHATMVFDNIFGLAGYNQAFRRSFFIIFHRNLLLAANLTPFSGRSIQNPAPNTGFAQRSFPEIGHMRVGVTGGAGYIGSHTVLALLEAGHEVVIVDDFSTGDRQNLQPSGTLVEGDFKKPDIMQKFLSHGLDAVFHFAALKAAGESMEQPEAYSAANVRGTLFLIENLARAKVRNVVFSSSAAVYGEPQYLPVDEAHPLVPINYYGFTKLCIEQNLEWFSRLGRIRFASLRYFNAAGYNRAGKIKGLERNTANLLPLVMEAAAGMRPELLVFGDDYQTRDGTGIRDYVHVEDLADAHVRALEFISDNNKDITVNLGSETGMSVMEMIKTTERISGQRVPSRIVARREGDPPELIASSALAHQLLGWKARYSDADTIISSMWNLYGEKK